MDPFIHKSVELSEDHFVGQDSRIWSNSQLGAGVKIGSNTTIGRNVYLGPGVVIGDNCKVQNNALIYEPALLDDGVFVGPGAILTNDKYPRAVNIDGTLKSNVDWNPVGVEIRKGASIGAGAICVAPLVIGEWALISAGAVVIHDVSPFSLVVGNPARRIGWVSPSGYPLERIDSSSFKCPITGQIYNEDLDGNLTMNSN